jgi:hypothetical protein
MLRPRGGEQEQLRFRVDPAIPLIQEQFPDVFSQRRAAGFFGHEHRDLSSPQIIAGHPDLGRLAAAFDPFKGDERFHDSSFRVTKWLDR